ncbi:ATP-binding protein, partial [Acinetobacter baumannii]|nr:ATP-binding protein [Acinetobacter baumannii]
MSHSFKVAARTLRHLGGELITSDEMALNELIKNAFDAGSKRVKVFINYPMNLAVLSKTLEDFTSLKINKNKALELIEINTKLYINPLNTAPLSTFLTYIDQVLNTINEQNKPNILSEIKDNFYNIKICDTGHGMTESELESVFLTIGTPSKLSQKSNGDRILLGEKGIGRLSMMKLGNKATVITKTIDDQICNSISFNWQDFDNPDLYLDEITIETQKINYPETFITGTQIHITELLSDWSLKKTEIFVKEYIQRLRSPFREGKSDFPIDILLNDTRLNITPIPSWLKEQSSLQAEYIFEPSQINSALHGSLIWKDSSAPDIRSWSIDDLSRILNTSSSQLNLLGPLKIKFLWFNRKDLIGTIERSLKNIKEELNLWVGGFSIYRDGFRIGFTGGLNDDWLKMDSKALKSQGYTFNRYQTVGEISISKIKNPNLKDTASRQSLVNNNEFELLQDLISEIIIKDTKSRIEDRKKILEIVATDAFIKSLDKSDESYKKASEALNTLSKNGSQEDKDIIDMAQNVMKNQNELINQLNAKMEKAFETNTDILELANLGQMVDIIAHELARITENTSNLLIRLKNSEDNKEETSNIMNELRKQIIATEKRIRSIDVLSPAVRQRKESYDITAQFKTILEGYAPKLQRHNINYKITVDDSSE